MYWQQHSNKHDNNADDSDNYDSDNDYNILWLLLYAVLLSSSVSLPAKPSFSLQGFPLISGQVFLDDASSWDPSRPLSSRPSMVVQMLTPLVAGFLAFSWYLAYFWTQNLKFHHERQEKYQEILMATSTPQLFVFCTETRNLRPEHEVFCEVGKAGKAGVTVAVSCFPQVFLHSYLRTPRAWQAPNARGTGRPGIVARHASKLLVVALLPWEAMPGNWINWIWKIWFTYKRY